LLRALFHALIELGLAPLLRARRRPRYSTTPSRNS
jgi:hypothetical protein